MLPPHTGVFWDCIRDRYPKCEEHPLIGHIVESDNVFARPSQRIEMVSAPPLSRQWFISDSGNELIQLQRDRFCYNWRMVKPSDAYPRYQHIRDRFEADWACFCDFVERMGQSAASVDQCEMTYINHIDQGSGWDCIADVEHVLPMLRWPTDSRFLPSPSTIGARTTFEMPDLGGRLHASLRHGIRTEDSQERKELLILELTARGMPGRTAPEELLEWYAMARERIVRAFTDLTTPAMHELWEREQ